MDSALPIAVGLLCLIAGTAVVQAVCVLAFNRALEHGRRPPPAGDSARTLGRKGNWRKEQFP